MIVKQYVYLFNKLNITVIQFTEKTQGFDQELKKDTDGSLHEWKKVHRGAIKVTKIGQKNILTLYFQILKYFLLNKT